jgi:hypothetical protein
MTTELAKEQLSKLQREREQAAATVAEYQSRIEILDVQIAAVKPLAEQPATKTSQS